MALTGFLVADKCAPDSLEAENALASQFPQYLGSTPPVMCSAFNTWYTPATKAYTLVITCHDLTSATQYQFTHDVILQPCDPAINPPQQFDPLLAASFWSFAMTFVLGCWLLAKNAGTIINAIKRW